ncbi:MAG: HD domain-containing protein [Hydrogenophaga sp.]|nr:HD domain-containing protein [Hydrogenophaga sp.]
MCQRIKDAGGQPYVVGGYVRDLLLGRQPKDVDIVVVGLPINKLAVALGMSWTDAVGKQFPVLIVDGVEVAVARSESKVALGHKGFACETEGVTLEQDLVRRDLTINAMALDPFTDKIIDPYGGAKDLEARVLRPVGPHFGEDPVRILRAARFSAQLDMDITDELIAVAEPALAELVDEPGERLWGELEKALRTRQPSRFIDGLDRLGALEIVLPEIAALKGRIQPEKYHPEGDAYVHTLEVVDRAAELGGDDEAMFAALTHDLGKAVTPDDNLPHHYNHEALGVPLVHAMCDRLHVPNPHRKVAAATSKDHLNVHRFNDLKPVKKVRLLMRLGAAQGDLLARRVVLASKADARGRGPLHADAAYEQGDALLEAAAVLRTVKGHQFANLKDGRVIAQKMEQARARALKLAGI